MLEVVVTTVEEAVEAEKYGADRLEVVANIDVGGLTPDRVLVKNILEAVQIPLAIMIRPHHNGFCYSDEDIQQMVEDIRYFAGLGVESFVLGVLDKTNEIDIEKLKTLVKACGETTIVFHKAIERTPDTERSILELQNFSTIRRVLTNFHIIDFQDRAKVLDQKVQSCREKGVEIVLGGGINDKAIACLLSRTTIKQFHVGSAVRINRENKNFIDGEEVKRYRALFHAVQK